MGILWWVFGYWLGNKFTAEICPELKENLIGAAVGGFATNITAVAEAVDGTVFSGFIPLALNGLANEYPISKGCMVKLSSVLDLHGKRITKLLGCFACWLSDESILYWAKQGF